MTGHSECLSISAPLFLLKEMIFKIKYIYENPIIEFHKFIYLQVLFYCNLFFVATTLMALFGHAAISTLIYIFGINTFYFFAAKEYAKIETFEPDDKTCWRMLLKTTPFSLSVIGWYFLP